MKKIFIVFGLLLGIQTICFASDEKEIYTDISQIHKVAIIPEMGEPIFYPKEYASYQDFEEKYLKTEHVKNLLINRLEMLILFKEKKEDPNFYVNYYETLLDSNRMAIKEYADPVTLSAVSIDIDYSNNRAITEHTRIIAGLLKEKLTVKPDPKISIAKIEQFIEKCSQSLPSEPGKGIHNGAPILSVN